MKWKIAFFAYCFLIFYVSSLTPEELPDQSYAVSDKVLHLLEYALLGILSWAAWSRGMTGFPWALFAFCL